MTEIHKLFPYEDLFNETVFGSFELDSFVANTLENASSSDAHKIKAFSNCLVKLDSIERAQNNWKEKVETAKILLEKTDDFVGVILNYYNKIRG